MKRRVGVARKKARRTRPCPSGKARYRDRQSAVVVLRNVQQRGGLLTRAYRCEMCKGWHLTSQR